LTFIFQLENIKRGKKEKMLIYISAAVFEIFSYLIHKIFSSKILVFIFEGQAKNTMVDIK
jgi:hypothetical protein